MNQLRSRRPLSFDVDSSSRVNYVLRRYGGLEVYVPRFTPPGTLAGIQSHLQHFQNQSSVGGTVVVADHIGPALQAPPAGQPAHILDGDAELFGDSTSSDSSDFRRWTGIINPFGKFTPLFGGRIVLGPGKGTFVFCLFFLAAVLIPIILEYVSFSDLPENFRWKSL